MDLFISCKKLWSKLVHPHFCSVNVFTEKGVVRYTGVIVKKVRDEIILQDSMESIDISELKSWCLNQKIEDFIITIQGLNVLSKTVFDSEQVFDSFPGLNADEFYFTESVINKSEKRVNLIRRTELETLCEQITQYDSLIRSIELGDSVNATLYKLQEKSALIKNGDNYIFDDKKLTQTEAVALSACLDLITLNKKNNNLNLYDRFSENVEDVYYRTWFNRLASPISVALIVIAVVSKIAMISYGTKLQNQELTFAYTQSEQMKINQLKEELNHLDQLGNLSGNQLMANFTEMSYLISELTPKSVEFHNLNLRPLKKQNNGEFKLENAYDEKSIYIIGSSPKVEQLNTFIVKLKLLEFISQVRILKINRNEKQAVSNFELHLMLK